MSAEPSPALPALARERPASEHLAAAGTTAEWERRAEWLESEAKAQKDPAARARLMLAASEVRALLGERADARRLAIQAAHHQPAPAFAAQQARALHHTHGDMSAMLRSLAEAARSAPSPALAAHAQYVAAEIQRLIQRDPGGARASLEAAERADRSDLRPALGRLLLELSQSQAAPQARLPDEAGAAALARALRAIVRLRGGEPARAGDGPVEALVLVDAQRALARGRPDQAAEALAPLASRAALAPALHWLNALWGSATAERREEALQRYRQLARALPGHDTRRALAARALAAGSWDDLRQLFDEPGASEPPAAPDADGLHAESPSAAPAGPAGAPPPSTPPGSTPRPTFTNLERAALAALVGQRPEPGLALSPLDTPAVASISAAVERASSRPPPGAARASSGDAAAELALGRAVAGLARLSDIWVDPTSDSPWALVLRLEQSREQRDGAALARDLPRLIEQPAAAAEYAFAAAVFAEQAGDLGAARQAFQAALRSPVTREAATRALVEHGADGAALFRALSAHADDPSRRALLLTETLLRLDPAAPEFDALAEDAWRTQPELPLALALGEAAACARADRPRLARWLARWRESARGPRELGLACMREAVHWLAVEPNAGAERLAQLAGRHDGQLWFMLGAERWLERAPRARADERRRIAGTLSERGRQHLLAEAVMLYEAAGDPAAACDAARELGGELGELWLARLARSDVDLERLAAAGRALAQRSGERALACELYATLARIERWRGRPERALACERERLALDPCSLEALRALEIADMAAGRERELEQTASALLTALGERDGLGHAYVAARSCIARGAFEEARTFVRPAQAAEVPPLWALRLGHLYAREDGDDPALLAICRSLRERSSQALDAATLSLHTAEAALRLGEVSLAREELERASELAPEDIVILSTRAEVLREAGELAEAAEALETLASATSSKRRQVDALFHAAVLWLDHPGQRARGMLALQEAAALDVPHAGLLERLVALRAQSDDLEGLGVLIERQRRLMEAPAGDASLELGRAREALSAGRIADARAIVDVLLEQRSRDPVVFQASADLHARAAEWEPAERDYRRVLELGGGARLELGALLGLEALYTGALARPELLPDVYAQIIARNPEADGARRKLVACLLAQGDAQLALPHQRELLARAGDDAERQRALRELVQLLDRCTDSSDRASEAETLLERARNTWPDDPRVLETEVAHYAAIGHPGTARLILERAASAARDALAAGRIERAVLDSLQVGARLAGDVEGALAASAMLAAVAGGGRRALPGARAGALDPALDELLAPALLGAELRDVLHAAGSALERAYALEPLSIEAGPAPDALATQVRELAAALGLSAARVFVSPQLGGDCRSLGGESLQLVVGSALLERGDPGLLAFSVQRALAFARLNAAALSRLAPDDIGAVLGGLCACFTPAVAADGVEAQRIVAARNRIRPHVTLVADPELLARFTALAEQLLPRAAELPAALAAWATRVALLGSGDPALALESVWARRHAASPLPPDEESRQRWIATEPEALDVVSYGVSEAYIEARRRAGLGAASP